MNKVDLNLDFSKVVHLDDFMSDEHTVMNTHNVWFGDDVYHDHDFYEIAYMLNGKIPHVVNEKQMDLVSGDMIFFRPCDKHLFLREDSTFVHGDFKARHRDVLFQKDFFNEVINFFGEDFSLDYHSPDLPIKINVSMEKLQEIEDSIESYYKLNHENSKDKLLYAKFILVKLLDCLMSDKTIKPDPNNSCRPWLKNLLKLMNMREHYKEGLSSIVSRFTYNYSYMCSAFKKYTGKTMTEYLNDLRLQYAASQIKLGSRSILSISQESGFSSISYFNKLFKQKYNCTPKEYKLKKQSK